MFRISRKTEYAALAVEYMVGKGGLASVREISDHFHIPYHLLAKILQRLASRGVLKSTYGTKGGYRLNRDPTEVNLADIVSIFEGDLGMTNCSRPEEPSCPQLLECSIRNPLSEINHKIFDLLKQTTLADLVRAGT